MAEETRRLAEAVRAVAADHDQVLVRMTALERNLDGVTGSIKRDRISGSQPASPPSPAQAPTQAAAQNAPTAAAPAARPDVPAPPPATEAATPAAQPPAAQQSASDSGKTAMANAGNRASPSPPVVRATNIEPAAAPPEPMVATGGLGIDVGGATNYEGLRTLWHSTKNSDPASLEELFPVVAIRENSKTHGADLRLVVGPVADAEAAARLCMTLSAVHHYCQPVAFEGQRLALNDPVPTGTLPPLPKRHPASSPPGKVEPEAPRFQAVIGK